MTAANTQAGIQTCRQAYTALMMAYDEWLVAKDQYVSLGLESVENSDFSDDLTALEFTAAADDMATVMDAFTPAIKASLRGSKL